VCDVGADEAHDDENDECDENQHNDADVNGDKTEHDPIKASAEVLKAEQRSDKSLAGCWSLAERQKAGYFVRDRILYRHQKIFGQDYEQLVLPFGRRAEVIKIGVTFFIGENVCNALIQVFQMTGIPHLVDIWRLKDKRKNKIVFHVANNSD